MEILTGDAVSAKVDYSFGDHHALWHDTIANRLYKPANCLNEEFLVKARSFRKRLMTLYIDNIRLYRRPIKGETDGDGELIKFLTDTNDLLALCSLLPETFFIIFTGQEDTPIDETIKLPSNVVAIFAVNAEYNNERIFPFPYGLQRKLNDTDNRVEIMKERVEKGVNPQPNKLLYLNCGIGRDPSRKPLEAFETNDWMTTRFDKNSMFFPHSRYSEYLDELQDHKFLICPRGHGLDCHRNWEALYLRRVPVMLKHPYHQRLLGAFPVLWVERWEDVTKELLEQNDHLYQKAQEMSLDNLDWEKVYRSILNQVTYASA